MVNSPKQRRITRDIAPLFIRAAIVPSSLNEEKRTVDVVWTTGAKVLRGFFERYYEELSLDPKHVRMGRLENGAPLLDSHRGYSLDGVIGVVESARLEKKKGVATVRFASDDERAESVFRKVREGVIRNISVGYNVHRYEKVEGGDDKIPVYRATDWEPFEISMVPMGADADARVRDGNAERNPCEFVEQERQMEDQNPQANLPGIESTTSKERAVEPVQIDVEQERTQAAKDERQRSADIRKAARGLRLPEEFADKHVEAGTDIAAFRAVAIEEAAKRTSPVGPPVGDAAIMAGEDVRDKRLRGAEHWLIQRAAVGHIHAEAAKKRGEDLKLDPGEFRGLSMQDLARRFLEWSGVRTSGMNKMTLIGEALTHRSGMNTTSDFAVLLENTMHKTLLAAYAVTPDTWSLFCAKGSVSDFRPHNRYRMGSFGRLEKINEHGEFKNQSIPDARKESISAVTKGNIIGLSRQSLVNDDMGAFNRLPIMLGRAARLSVEADVYDLIALNSGLGPAMGDGQVLFHSSHANINSTASGLSVGGLDADRVVMANQLDEEGNDYLDLRPSILLVPVGLGGEARVINDSQFDIDAVDAGTDEGNKFMKPNKVRGLFRTIVDTPRLAGTRRYLLADPNVAPTFEVAFLDGIEDPFLEVQNGWRIDGVEWKVRLDYGVAAIDYRGAVTNAGA